MYQLLETIRIENKTIINQQYHQNRIDDSTSILQLNRFDLNEIEIPNNLTNAIYKLRIIYSNNIELIEYEKYKIKNINKLKIITDNEIEYKHKFIDRTRINQLFEKRKECDDIIILKHNKITDTSFSNLIFVRNGEYFTPKYPLLNGTKRKYLIDNKIINPIDIYLGDLDKYEYCKIINAMINIEESPLIKNIY